MSSLIVRDLSHSHELDRRAMSAVQGGQSYASPSPLANVKVDIGILQNITQVQDVKVNALNNVGVIGAGFVAPSFNVGPSQYASTNASPMVF